MMVTGAPFRRGGYPSTGGVRLQETMPLDLGGFRLFSIILVVERPMCFRFPPFVARRLVECQSNIGHLLDAFDESSHYFVPCAT